MEWEKKGKPKHAPERRGRPSIGWDTAKRSHRRRAGRRRVPPLQQAEEAVRNGAAAGTEDDAIALGRSNTGSVYSRSSAIVDQKLEALDSLVFNTQILLFIIRIITFDVYL